MVGVGKKTVLIQLNDSKDGFSAKIHVYGDLHERRQRTVSDFARARRHVGVAKFWHLAAIFAVRRE